MTLDEIAKLSDNEIRVKVAELSGWTVVENHGTHGGVLARQPKKERRRNDP